MKIFKYCSKKIIKRRLKYAINFKNHQHNSFGIVWNNDLQRQKQTRQHNQHNYIRSSDNNILHRITQINHPLFYTTLILEDF